MKLKIEIEKGNAGNGRRYIDVVVSVSDSSISSNFFIKDYESCEYRLRSVEDGVLEPRCSDYDEVLPSGRFYLSTDQEIEKFVEEIKETARKLKDNLWGGEKTIEVEL